MFSTKIDFFCLFSCIISNCKQVRGMRGKRGLCHSHEESQGVKKAKVMGTNGAGERIYRYCADALMCPPLLLPFPQNLTPTPLTSSASLISCHSETEVGAGSVLVP